MELLFKLLKCVDKEKQQSLGFTETQTTESIHNFYALYVLNEGLASNVSKKIFEQRKLGLIQNSDFIIKSLVIEWINIPFNYSILPTEVYVYLQECSKYLVMPKRVDDIIAYGNEMAKRQQN